MGWRLYDESAKHVVSFYLGTLLELTNGARNFDLPCISSERYGMTCWMLRVLGWSYGHVILFASSWAGTSLNSSEEASFSLFNAETD
jgi:hypothetical protein